MSTRKFVFHVVSALLIIMFLLSSSLLPARALSVSAPGNIQVLADTLQQAYIKASNTGASDYFGSSVAIDGDTAIVGARGENSNATGVNGNQADESVDDAGAAYIFVRNGTTWSQQAYLKSANTGEIRAYFGYAVAVSGDTVAVSAINESGLAGAVYVFVRNGTTWSQQARLSSGGSQFGLSLALSGDTLVIGAPYQNSNAGVAYVFTRSGTTWSQQAALTPSNANAYDLFASSVSISGDTLLVGAPNEDSNGNQVDNSISESGAAYVFTRSGTIWNQQAYIKASTPGAGDFFGSAVSVSGDILAVGAYNEYGGATGINGNQNDNSVAHAGAAYIFARSGTTWSQQAYVKASNTGTGDEFGHAVAVSGDMVAVSAHLEDSNSPGINGNQSDESAQASGAVYLFTHTGSNWSQSAYIKSSDPDNPDMFGESISLSGNTLFVGADGESSNATGINGNYNDNSLYKPGAAYVFTTPGIASPTTTPTATGTPSPTPTVTATTITPTSTHTNPAPTTTPTATGTPSQTPTVTATTITPTSTYTNPAPTTATPITRTPTPTKGATKTATPVSITVVIKSNGAQDGWVLESSETSGIGGSINSTAYTLNVGNLGSKKHYRGILSFDTSIIPDNATITGVTLKFRQQAIVHARPRTPTFQGFMVDIKTGFFGTFAALQPLDFQADASKTLELAILVLTDGFYNLNLLTEKTPINTLATNDGLTQIRLRLKLDDDNNAPVNYLKLYSGDAKAAYRPQLIVTYTIP